jgi:hypothetical protein
MEIIYLSKNKELYKTKNKRNTMTKQELLHLSLEEFEKQCKYQPCRVSGPGGQHRNKTESGIRIHCLLYPEIIAIATERRSQHENKKIALQRLRKKIALQIQVPPTKLTTALTISTKNHLYALHLSTLSDALWHHQFHIKETATFLEISSGQLIKQISNDPELWQITNQERKKQNLHPLNK